MIQIAQKTAAGLFVISLLSACGPKNSTKLPEQYQLDAEKSDEDFPLTPEHELTPGSLCQRPDEYRYPEGIKYCERRVSTNDKRQVIESYDEALGYNIRSMNRSFFKVDHFIPLCLGGSNNPDNLWPQHESVYTLTDPVEFKLCVLIQKGAVSQEDAVDTVRYSKVNLDQVEDISDDLDNRIDSMESE